MINTSSVESPPATLDTGRCRTARPAQAKVSMFSPRLGSDFAASLRRLVSRNWTARSLSRVSARRRCSRASVISGPVRCFEASIDSLSTAFHSTPLRATPSVFLSADSQKIGGKSLESPDGLRMNTYSHAHFVSISVQGSIPLPRKWATARRLRRPARRHEDAHTDTQTTGPRERPGTPCSGRQIPSAGDL